VAAELDRTRSAGPEPAANPDPARGSLAETLLECDQVTRYFGALAAVKDLSFRVERGQLFGIAGPNGAGKTTLFNLLSGHVPVSSGSIRYLGAAIEGLPPHAICHRGIARTFQVPQVFASGTVEENVLVGAYFGRRTGLPGFGFDRATRDRVDRALEMTGLSARRWTPAPLVSVYDKKRLMIASALATEPELLLLDEPFGGLNPGEIDQLVGLIRKLHGTGLTILLIEHVMRALMTLSQRVLIMHHGEELAEGTPAEIQRDQQVIRVYLGQQAGAARA
jgi:branched-chain amino acid transport system ATP-binding protein